MDEQATRSSASGSAIAAADEIGEDMIAASRRGESVRSFARDRSTWLVYLAVGYFAYLETVLGPLVPFLRADLGLSHTVAGWHLAAFAAGAITIGLLGERILRGWGRRATFWRGAGGMGGGALLVAVSPSPVGTIAGEFLMGLCGNLLLITTQAELSERHGARRAVAIAESNVVASACAILAAVAVGGFASVALGWRAAPVAPLALLAILAVAFRTAPLGGPARPAGDRRRPVARLPGRFWALWAVLALGVAIEWSVAFWGADFLAGSAGLPRAAAATAMSAFFGAMLIGRLVGSRLARLTRAVVLLTGALAVTLAGFPLFWRAPTAGLTLVGLFVVGIGIANVYPFALAAAAAVAPDQVDAATARLALGAGGATLITPMLLGALADRAGIEQAFGVVAPLLVIALAAALATLRR